MIRLRSTLFLATASVGMVGATSAWTFSRDRETSRMKVDRLLANAQTGTETTLVPEVATRHVVAELRRHAREHGPIESYRMDPIDGFVVVEARGTVYRRGRPYRFNARCVFGKPIVHFWEWPPEETRGKS